MEICIQLKGLSTYNIFSAGAFMKIIKSSEIFN